MKTKILSLVLAITLILTIFPLSAISDENTLTFNYSHNSNSLQVTGVHPSRTEGEEISIMVYKYVVGTPLTDAYLMSNLVWIDQVTTGANGGFIFDAGIVTDLQGVNLSGVTLAISLGATSLTTEINNPVITYKVLADSNFTIANVANNSLRLGNDVFEISSSYLTSEYILDSMKTGGNKIYYKIGGYWYDLLDSNYNNSDFLIPSNAIPVNEVATWKPNIWYRSTGNPVYFTN